MKNDNGQTSDRTMTEPPLKPQRKRAPKPDLPSAFELADLATKIPAFWREMDATVINPPPRRPLSAESAVHAAMELWETAAEVRRNKAEADQQLRELFDGIFTLEHDEFIERIKAFKGERAAIALHLRARRYPTAEVAEKLFPSESRATRKIFLMALPGLGLTHRIDFVGPTVKRSESEIKKELEASTISAQLCRWLVSAREKQKSLNMKRDIPLSVRQRQQGRT